MATDTQDRISISTEENDDVIVDTFYDNVVLLDQNGPNPAPEQLNPMNTFPWMPDFIILCQAEIGITQMRNLEKLMKFYQKQVSQSVKDCYSRPIRAAKLKRLMGDTLLFFHMSYSALKPPLEHSSYLAKMSDLMAMYLDMEIKASRTGTESLPKIASKLTSSLHIYFGRSQEHILDTVLKSKIITKNFWELSDLIFRRVLRDTPGAPIHIFTYIRYILAFKMWKGIMKEADERKKIAQLAAVKLPPPEGFKEKMTAGVLRDILPRVPKSRSDVTAFLMQAKFPVRDKIKLFLKAVQDPKLQCALDRQTFNSIEAFPAEQEDSEISTLMNDIWSSMSIDNGIHDPLRDNFGRSDKVRKTKNISKLKSEHLKKKRKKVEVIDEIGEDDKPSFDEINVDDDVNFIKLEIEDAPPKAHLEQHVINKVHESEAAMEIAAEVEFSATANDELDTSVKVETQPTHSKEATDQAQWNNSDLQKYYNNVSFDYLGDTSKDYVVVTEPSPSCVQPQEVYEIVVDGTEQTEEVDVITTDKVSTPEIETAPSSHLIEQEVPKATDDETSSDKAVMKDIKITEEYNMEKDSIGVLHDYTIKSDSKMYEFQIKVYSYSSKLNVRTWIGLLSPLFCEQSRLKMYRCCCAGCKHNLAVIRRNWKNVMTAIMRNSEKSDQDLKNVPDENGYTYENSFEDLKAVAEGEKGDIMYWETEIENLLKKIDETVKEDSESSSLPLKKRKAFTYNNSGAPTSKDDKPAMSYPCTPMISIAEIELVKHKFYNMGMPLPQENVLVPNYQSPFPAHHVYPNLLVCKPTSPEPAIPPQQSLVPGAYTTTFLPPVSNQEQDLTSNKRITFKTPAQLKEFIHQSATEEPISLANTSQTYDENEEDRPRRQTRRKTKYTSRKRKRT